MAITIIIFATIAASRKKTTTTKQPKIRELQQQELEKGKKKKIQIYPKKKQGFVVSKIQTGEGGWKEFWLERKEPKKQAKQRKKKRSLTFDFAFCFWRKFSRFVFFLFLFYFIHSISFVRNKSLTFLLTSAQRFMNHTNTPTQKWSSKILNLSAEFRDVYLKFLTTVDRDLARTIIRMKSI